MTSPRADRRATDRRTPSPGPTARRLSEGTGIAVRTRQETEDKGQILVQFRQEELEELMRAAAETREVDLERKVLAIVKAREDEQKKLKAHITEGVKQVGLGLVSQIGLGLVSGVKLTGGEMVKLFGMQFTYCFFMMMGHGCAVPVTSCSLSRAVCDREFIGALADCCKSWASRRRTSCSCRR